MDAAVSFIFATKTEVHLWFCGPLDGVILLINNATTGKCRWPET